MSKAAAIIVLGFFTAFLPFTGFPSVVKITLAVVFGLLIMALGFLVLAGIVFWAFRTAFGRRLFDFIFLHFPFFSSLVKKINIEEE